MTKKGVDFSAVQCTIYSLPSVTKHIQACSCVIIFTPAGKRFWVVFNDSKFYMFISNSILSVVCNLELNSKLSIHWPKLCLVTLASDYFYYRVVLNKCTCLNKHAPRSPCRQTPKFWWNIPLKQVQMGGKWLKNISVVQLVPGPSWVSVKVQGTFIQHYTVCSTIPLMI